MPQQKLPSGALSPREIETVRHVHDCLPNKEIAYRMGVTEATVKEYLHRIFKKRGFSNRTQLAVWAHTGLGVLLLAFAGLLGAQTPGTVASLATTSVTGTTATVICVLTSTAPSLPSGIQIFCKIGANQVLGMNATVSAATNGVVGSFTNAGDTVTWLVNQPSGQPTLSWQMAANGVSKSGTF